jgi:hypothetical protein
MGIQNKINNLRLFIFDDFRKNLGRKFGGRKGYQDIYSIFFTTTCEKSILDLEDNPSYSFPSDISAA